MVIRTNKTASSVSYRGLGDAAADLRSCKRDSRGWDHAAEGATYG